MKRTIYNHLTGWKNRTNRKPLILKGARQVGKTYILKKFGREAFPRAHYVNFEEDESLCSIFNDNLNPKRILQELSFYVESSINPEKDLLIFDEIQACPRALTILKYFQEELPGFSVCAAGSLLGLQLGQSSFPVGKVTHLEMFPMGFEEFLDATGNARYSDLIKSLCLDDSIPDIAHQHLWDFLKLYLITGGLPEVVKIFTNLKDDLFTAVQSVRKKQSELIKDYMADMAKHSGKQNAMHIERIWKSLPAQLAREQNGSASKYRFKGVVPGISAYARLAGAIDWLDTAGLILKVPIINCGEIPFATYTSENRFKLFCFDVGILGAVSGLPPKSILDYDYGTYKGYFAESFAAQEFKYAGLENIYCWREKKAEVEFVREVEGEVIPIEIKSGWVTQAKSLKVFADKYAPPYRVVMSARNFKLADTGKHRNYPLYLAAHFPMG